jgi:pimeloyl-ACP methyl ester carboxylesterase
MYYKKIGNGSQKLLLVHGFMCDGTVWDGVISKLLDDFEIIIPDLDGYGFSSELLQYKTLEVLAIELKQILDDEGIEKVTYIGHSMGGYIGLEFLEHFEPMLNHFVMLNSHIYTDSDERSTNRTKTIGFLQKYGSKLYVKESFRTLFSPEFAVNHSEIVAKMMENAHSYPVQTLINSCQAMIERKNHEQTIQNLRIPVHFLMGEVDSLIPLEEYKKMTLLNLNAKTQVLSKGGHMGMHENAEEVVEYILKNLI